MFPLPAASSDRVSSVPAPFQLRGDEVGCACPRCGSAESVVVTARSAACTRCGEGAPLTPEQTARVRERLDEFRRSLEAVASETRSDDAPVPAGDRETVPALPWDAAPEPRFSARRRSPRFDRVAGPVRVRNLAHAPGPLSAPEAPVAPVTPIAAPAVPLDAAPTKDDPLDELDVFRKAPGWVVSALVHLALVVALGLFFITVEKPRPVDWLTGSLGRFDDEPAGGREDAFEWGAFEVAAPADEAPSDSVAIDAAVADVARQPPAQVAEVPISFEPTPVLVAPDPTPDPAASRDPHAGRRDRRSDPNAGAGPSDEPTGPRPGGFDGRGAGPLRDQLVKEWGGTEESETAIARGLRWLAKVQEPEGCWTLNKWGGSGGAEAGTALGVLPFLGAGQTHRSGQYQRTVYRALSWLLARQRPDGGFNNPPGVGMYSHGLASISLCEAYGMTRDTELRGPAQRAIDFIVAAQNRPGGGWRYAPLEPGDMSVTGWQVMALRSARLAGLDVPDETLGAASRFVEACGVRSSDSDYPGDRYAYQPGQTAPSPTMTAEALLCRQYSGWKRSSPAMRSAVAWMLQRHLPEPSYDQYYVYYATQAIHHYGGDSWKRWNARVRDLVVEAQIKSGEVEGSWTPDNHWTVTGGRICSTSLSLLTLEVYYRHLPLYDEVEKDVAGETPPPAGE